MKICFFCGNANLSGGTERVSSIIANELVNNEGIKIVFLSLYEGDKPFFELDSRIECYSLFSNNQSFSKKYFSVVSRLRKFIIYHNVNIIINVESILSLYSIASTFSLPVRNICWEHFNYNVDLGLKSRRIARHLAAIFCDDIVLLTERDKELWLDHTYNRSNMTVISNPVTIIPSFNSSKVNNKKLLAVGRFTHQKGFDLLLKSWALVLKERTDWSLEIVGDGEDRKLLEALINHFNLNETVTLSPITNNITDKFNSSSLFVLSSRFEGFGLVLLEAQASGLPAISFDCDVGPREIISEDSGWLCRANCFQDLAVTILNAFRCCDDESKYQNLSQVSSFNATRFSVSNISDKWKNLLNIN
ncbi:glycosyltransferase family 4 protein [Vibrio cyclitrophicus]|uniref:glycosyltransferase family 4 protein n=1 Tax=Vibrio cyclitrophicus TaxID=47951 RepID=UPI00148D138C|nr:glycosyltransferase family 4 protein [Vibrio cyclitrophicus]NOI36779.1 glycosyltransferase family 4 protein [Vibrio cyclitrophicus]